MKNKHKTGNKKEREQLAVTASLRKIKTRKRMAMMFWGKAPL
jgi:hypothetical protein